MPPFPEEFLIRIDESSEAAQDRYNSPGFLKQDSTFVAMVMTIALLRKIASTKSGLILLNALKATENDPYRASICGRMQCQRWV